MRGGAANVRVNHFWPIDRITAGGLNNHCCQGAENSAKQLQRATEKYGLWRPYGGPKKFQKWLKWGRKIDFINDLMFHNKQILNGVCHEICGFIFISRFEPIWNPDKQAKLFSNLVRSLTLRCENTAESKNEGKKSRVPVPLSCAYRPCRTPLLSLSS